jgi:type II secretory pathway component GspD/PulD (secretin)
MKPHHGDVWSMSENLKRMKSKLCLLTVVGLAAASLAVFAQDNTPTGGSSGAPSVTSTNEPAPPPAATPTPAPAEPAAAPGAAPKSDATTPADPAAAPGEKKDADKKDAATPEAPAPGAPLVAANVVAQPAAEKKDAAPAEGAAGAASTNTPGAAIQMIVMDDVPLTDAIKNLARQAGLNYMLDPKVPYGQIDAQGHTTPQPTVSIRWENVTSEQALNALLNNYNLMLIEDPKSKIARITVKDPAAPDPLVTKVIQLKFASPTNIMGTLQNALTDKRSKVVADVRTSQLVVLATEKELVDIDQLVVLLDKRTKQVLIEARLLETQMNPNSNKGIDWTGTVGAQNVAFGNNLQTAPVTSQSLNPPLASLFPKIITGGGSSVTYFLNADGVNATLHFLNTYAETKVISAPRTVTLDNELSTIEVGTMYPIVNVTAGTANTTGGSSVSYSNLTVKLDVTPRISANNFVNLKVVPKIMRLGDNVVSVVGNQNNSVSSFLTRQLQTSVLIPSGNTLVMGGLIEDNVHTENTKVPVLGDIPGVGLLFRFDSKRRQKSNLIVFVTPTIVEDSDYQPTKSDYLQTPVPTSDSIEGDWSAWDSGKPKDWSKKNKNAKTASVQPEQPAQTASVQPAPAAQPVQPAADKSAAAPKTPAADDNKAASVTPAAGSTVAAKPAGEPATDDFSAVPPPNK